MKRGLNQQRTLQSTTPSKQEQNLSRTRVAPHVDIIEPIVQTGNSTESEESQSSSRVTSDPLRYQRIQYPECSYERKVVIGGKSSFSSVREYFSYRLHCLYSELGYLVGQYDLSRELFHAAPPPPIRKSPTEVEVQTEVLSGDMEALQNTLNLYRDRIKFLEDRVRELRASESARVGLVSNLNKDLDFQQEELERMDSLNLDLQNQLRECSGKCRYLEGTLKKQNDLIEHYMHLVAKLERNH